MVQLHGICNKTWALAHFRICTLADCFNVLWKIGKKYKQQHVTMKFVTSGKAPTSVGEKAKTIKLKRLIFRKFTFENISQFRTIHLQWRVWSWLRMNASGRLNTCKSRGMVAIPETGKRVRNTYRTYLYLGHSPEKSGLTPHNIFEWHHLDIKNLLGKDGCASH